MNIDSFSTSKAEFGDSVCFHGAVENQNILPYSYETAYCRGVSSMSFPGRDREGG